MATEIITLEDLKRELERFKIELLADLAKSRQQPETVAPLLRSAQVRKLLNISPGTLQKLRIKGILPYSRIDGAYRYLLSDVQKAIQGLNK